MTNPSPVESLADVDAGRGEARELAREIETETLSKLARIHTSCAIARPLRDAGRQFLSGEDHVALQVSVGAQPSGQRPERSPFLVLRASGIAPRC